MKKNKYIGTKEAARLTGLSIEEVYELIHSGKIPAHKAPKSGWRISPQDLVGLGLMKEDSEEVEDESLDENRFMYVADDEHFTQVFRRMTEVKTCLKIATGNLKNFNVTIESDLGCESIHICEFFLSLVERGVHVQVVCMKPLDFFNKAKELCPQLLESPLFELRLNDHNHMKVFIFDDVCAYVGSANVTSAAIGKRARRKKNYEAGFLIWGAELMSDPLRHFERVWNDPDTEKSTWKRFAKKAKECKKILDERIKGRIKGTVL